MKKFFVSKNQTERIEFVKQIEGKKIAIYNGESSLLPYFDHAVDMSRLMEDEYFLEKILLCDSSTTLVLIDVLIKNGIYVHPYGKIFRFTEIAKQTIVIDSFIFRYTERNIIRPFLFIDTSVFGTSMIGFHASEDSTIENYHERIRPYIDCRIKPIELEVVYYAPTEEEKEKYHVLKLELVSNVDNGKAKIVETLISFVDGLESKRAAIAEARINYPGSFVVTSNKPKNKFKTYGELCKEEINSVVFISSETFGADELELKTTMEAINRHNKLIKLLK